MGHRFWVPLHYSRISPALDTQYLNTSARRGRLEAPQRFNVQERLGRTSASWSLGYSAQTEKVDTAGSGNIPNAWALLPIGAHADQRWGIRPVTGR